MPFARTFYKRMGVRQGQIWLWERNLVFCIKFWLPIYNTPLQMAHNTLSFCDYSVENCPSAAPLFSRLSMLQTSMRQKKSFSANKQKQTITNKQKKSFSSANKQKKQRSQHGNQSKKQKNLSNLKRKKISISTNFRRAQAAPPVCNVRVFEYQMGVPTT